MTDRAREFWRLARLCIDRGCYGVTTHQLWPLWMMLRPACFRGRWTSDYEVGLYEAFAVRIDAAHARRRERLGRRAQ